MFAEKEIRTSATCVAAMSLWLTSILLWAVSWAMDERYIAVLAILVCGGAVTATVRAYFIAQTEQLRTALLVTGREPRSDVTRLR